MSTTQVPSNVDIKSGLETAKEAIQETKEQQKKRLTPEGKEILETTEHLLQESSRFIEEKNPDDLVQRIISEAQHATDDLQHTQVQFNQFRGSLKQLSSDELRKRLLRVYETSKYTALELIASASFRQTFYDFFFVLYSCFIDASQIDRIGQPLREAIERAKEGETGEAGEELKVAAEETMRRVIDLKDPQQPFFATLSQEQIDQLADRAIKMLNNIAERERSKRLIANCLDVWDLLRDPIEKLVTQVEVASETISEKMETDEMKGTHLEQVLTLSRQLFEQMTGRSMEVFVSHMRVAYRTVLNDPELKEYSTEVRTFLHDILADKTKAKEVLTEKQQRDKIRDLIEKGQKLVQKKAEGEEKSLRENMRVCYEEIFKMIYALEDDPTARAIQDDLNKLVSQILLDENGKVTFKPDVLDQLRVIVTSLVLHRLRYPLPPLSFGEDDPNANLVFTVSGMVLDIRDLLPKQIIAENAGLAIVNLKRKPDEETAEVQKAHEAVRILFKNMCVHLPDAYLKFDYRGFPSVKDEGNAFIEIGGKGMDAMVRLESQMGSDRLLNLAKVEVVIHDLTLKLEGTRHDILYNLFVTVFKPRIKTHIERAIEESLATQFVQLNDMIERQAKVLREKVPSAVQSTFTKY